MTLPALRAFLAASLAALALFSLAPLPAEAQNAPLRLRITEGVIEPMPIAIAPFLAQSGGAEGEAAEIAAIIAADLVGTGFFRTIPPEAHISRVTNFDAPVQHADWRAINAEALVTGAVERSGGKIVVKFRLHDVVSGQQMGDGLRFDGTPQNLRRMAHKVADVIYSRLTGEAGYFDSRIVFVSESGPKDARVKRLAVADYDGANMRMLTDGGAIVIAPRFSPDGSQILYTSYETGEPRIYLMEADSGRRRALSDQPGSMTFAPRFSPDGRTVVFSLAAGGNTDIYTLDVRGGAPRRLTSAPSIETAPSFAPDGSAIVFESDRTGSQQIYVMSAGGGEARRISQGRGRYGTPVWSPRGDLIAFTKQLDGKFHIGVMRTDGSEERLLTASFLDEGPTWAPNGRVLMFTREAPGAGGLPALYTVEIGGRTPPRRIPVDGGASDPAWSPLLP